MAGLGQANLPQQFICTVVSLVPVNACLASPFVSEEHILSDTQIGYQCQFLMNDYNALGLAVLNGLKLTNLTIVQDIALIAAIGINAAQNIHQRAFSRSVLTNQRMNFALLDFEVYVVQRANAGKQLYNVLHFEKSLCHLLHSRFYIKFGRGSVTPPARIY